MLLSVHMFLESADAGSLGGGIPWGAIQTPVFILQGLCCVAAGLWAYRAHMRNGRRAELETNRDMQRFTRTVIAHQARTVSALRIELERNRWSYERASEREWGMAKAEIGIAYERLAAQLEGAEVLFREEHDRTIGRFNEALVVIQQAGMAAARIVARKSGPDTRQRY